MSFISFGGGGSSGITLPDTTYVRFGHNGTGGGAVVTNGGTVGSKTNSVWVQLEAEGTEGSLPYDITDLEIFMNYGGSSSGRFMVDIGIGATSSSITTIIPDIWSQPSTGGLDVTRFPLNLTAGTKIWARCTSSGATAGLQVHGRGIRSSANYKFFDNCEAIVAATVDGTVVPKTGLATTVNTANTGWLNYISSSAREYKAFVINPTTNSTVTYPAAPGMLIAFRFGYGDTGGGIPNIVTSYPIWMGSGSPINSTQYCPIFKTIPAGTRIAIEAVTTGAATTLGFQIWGLW